MFSIKKIGVENKLLSLWKKLNGTPLHL